MSTRTRSTTYAEPSLSSSGPVDLTQLSDQELEAFLFQEEKQEKTSSWSMLPTLTGGAMMLVGVLYMLQEYGRWNAVNMTGLATILPMIAGILIVVLGFGLFKKKSKPVAAQTRVRPVQPPIPRSRTQPREEVRTETFATSARTSPPPLAQRKTLMKSTNKKISGVAGGIAEYFNIDPTWVRVAFVIGLFAHGVAVLVYIAMALVLPSAPKLTLEERLRMLRNS